MPKVSVIIPVYNCEKYIRQTIESVLAQTYKGFELIVVDDGSTDRSGRIVREEFGEAKYYFQRNGGAAKARNAGVEKSSGEYIAFLDADDIWVPEKLAVQVSILDDKRTIGVVHSDVEYIDSFGGHVKFWKNSQRSDAYQRQFLKGHAIGSPASLMRREIFVKLGGFDEDFPAAGYEDLEFFIRVGQACEIYCVETPLVKCRDHPDSTCRNEGGGLGNRGIFLQKLITRFGNDPEHKRFVSREQARYLCDIGRYLIRNGKLVEGRKELVQSIVLSAKTCDLPIVFRSLHRLLESFVGRG